MLSGRVLVVVCGAAAVAVAAAAVVLGVAAAPANPSAAAMIVQSVAIVVTAGVGMLIGVRLPGHRVGAVLAVAALLFALVTAADAYGRYVVLDSHASLPAGDWAVLWANASWPVMFAGVAAVVFVFPDGRLPSAGWRAVAWAGGCIVAGTVVIGLFTAEPFDAPFQDVPNPLPARPDILAPLEVVLLAGLAASVAAAGWAARHRYVRSVQPQRQQLLWLAASAWLIPLTLAVCVADVVVPGDLDWLVLSLLLITTTAVPAAIAVAILRYRLYDLDRLVNRALVYGVLTALVVAAYLGAIIGLGWFVHDRNSFVVALVATVIVLVAANPVRSWLQRRVDRLMYGDRRDPYGGLSRLAARLEASVTPQMALRTIVDTVADSLKVPFVAIDLRHPDRLERTAVHGSEEPEDALGVPLSFQGDHVGMLVVGPRSGDGFTGADRRLLDGLARHAGAVVHATRLTIELQASRERLVVAQEEVRRRLRRDLHDGLGPRLAAAIFQVDLARDTVALDAAAADSQLETLRRGLQSAVEEIRGMAYALRPPALDEAGLVPALTEQVASMNLRGSGPRIVLTAPDALPPLTPAVEESAYRIAMEAVANAVRHSGAQTCSVRLTLDAGLHVEVADDGATDAHEPFRVGVGIASMKERASELGATLSIEQGPTGTRVHTVLPVGAG
jgi:two-component system NarL family sensor kinase